MERWEQLEDYLMGRMEESRSRQLEERMKIDRQLTDDFDEVRRAHSMLNDAFVEQQMRDTLQQLRTEQHRQPTVWYNHLKWNQVAVWTAAACLLLVGYLSLSPITLPDAGYDVRALRGVDTTQLPPQQRAAFANFFEGQVRMVEGDYVLAAHHFENVLLVDDLRPYFREAAEWHLAVSYLRSRQINRASQLYKRLKECEPCAYKVGWLERRKMEWQLLIADLTL
ncbi:hypothetical protein GCM10027341_34800 [Spirosoma knui]